MLRRIPLLFTLVIFSAVLIACGSSGDSGSSNPANRPAGAGALQIVVDPNPIVAQRVSGDRYQFPFTVVIRETGGARVDVNRVGIDARAAGLPFYSQSLNRDEIARRGYPTTIPANGELRYSMSPASDVPNDALFNAVSGEVFVEGTDEHGNSVRATANVSVRR